MYVEKWYDRYTRSWVVQVKDKNGYQVGNAVYVYSKREAVIEEDRLNKEIEKGMVIAWNTGKLI